MKRGRPKGRSNDKKSYGPLGDVIRKNRMEKGLGLLDVAKACKCSVQFISNIEHGRAPLPWDKAEMLAKYLKIPFEELQAANLAIRSDFKSFVKNSRSGLAGKRVAKSATALEGVKDAASLVTITAQDAKLRDIIQRYQTASATSKKKFYQSAKQILGN